MTAQKHASAVFYSIKEIPSNF